MNKKTKEMYRKINKIVDRIFKDGLDYSDRLTILMDLEAAHKDKKMDLDKFLGMDKFNFGHDVYGIADNINRKTAKLDNCFLPRCAR